MLPAKSPLRYPVLDKSETQPIGLAAIRLIYDTLRVGKNSYIPRAIAPTSLNFAIANPPKTRDGIFTVWQE
jgi:hypothetical protein